MKLQIDPIIFEQYPGTLIGVVTLEGVDNHGEASEIQSLLREAEQVAIQRVDSIPIIEHPNIACWREVYRKFGAKPKKYPSSIENLARRVSAGEQIRHINKLVDIYNVISLRYLLPVGGEDTEKIVGDIRLTIAGDAEPTVTLLGEKEARPPYLNEVIYTDDLGAICRRWNWKEADRTKLTEATTNACIVIEAIPPVKRTELEQALADLSALIKQFCGGTHQVAILDSQLLSTKLRGDMI